MGEIELKSMSYPTNPERIRKIRSLAAKGIPYERIASRVLVSVTTVRKYADPEYRGPESEAQGLTEQEGTTNQPYESAVAPKGDAEEGSPLQFAKSQGIKIPAGQQKGETIANNLVSAAKDNKTVLMTYQGDDWDEPKVYHAEPYGFRVVKNGKPAPLVDTYNPETDGSIRLWAYDRTGKGIRQFSVDNIVNVTPTKTTFDPRWKVEIPGKQNQGEATGASCSRARECEAVRKMSFWRKVFLYLFVCGALILGLAAVIFAAGIVGTFGIVVCAVVALVIFVKLKRRTKHA